MPPSIFTLEQPIEQLVHGEPLEQLVRVSLPIGLQRQVDLDPRVGARGERLRKGERPPW